MSKVAARTSLTGTVKFGERDPEMKREDPYFNKVTVRLRLNQDNYSVGYIGRLEGLGQVNLGVIHMTIVSCR